MTNLRSLNQQHPFWDWINDYDGNNAREGTAGPSSWPAWGQPHGPVPHSGASSPSPHEREHETPPAAGLDDDPPVSTPHEHHGPPHGAHTHGPHPHHHGPRHGHHRGGHGGLHGGGGGHGRGFGRGGRGGGGRPPFGGPFGGGRGFPFGGPRGGPGNAPFDLPGLANWVQNTFLNPQKEGNSDNPNANNEHSAQAQDFTPAVDIFSAEEAYVVHASLPGAKKEDIAVNWDAASSTLILTGVVHRPGDEQLLRALEVSERQVGAFERKVVLGTTEEPAKVDEEGIAAKLEDGILRITVPKLGREEDFVEVKRVDVQ